MNRQEFLALFPRKPIHIYGGDGSLIANIPVPHDAVRCDLCNDDPGDDIFVIIGSNAYCAKCAVRSILPYARETPHESR